MRFNGDGIIVQVCETHCCAVYLKQQTALRKQITEHTDQVRAYLDSALVQKAVESNT